MVFSTTNLFKGIACPEGDGCTLTNCMFGHDLGDQQTETSQTHPNAASQKTGDAKNIQEPPTKRRKVIYDNLESKPPSAADRIRSNLAAARNGSTEHEENDASKPKGMATFTQASTRDALPSLTRPVSPPPSNGKATSQAPGKANFGLRDNKKVNNSDASTKREPASEPVEKLNPRLVAKDPIGHAKRSLYLKHLHGEVVRLNEVTKQSSTLNFKQALVLNEQELIKVVLDEEEKVAREQPQVYANIVKQRIAAYKKMHHDDFIKLVRAKFRPNESKINGPKGEKIIDTGLSLNQELLVLPQLVADQSGLRQYGYIPTPPTDAEVAEALVADKTNQNFEVCDRCSSRFQVYPERNEEGLLTSHGPCRFHPNRKVFPQTTKGERVQGLQKEPYHPCCDGVVGSPGCTEHPYHVFKTSSPARLAAVLPFINTPENKSPAKDKHGKVVGAITFDCEMGYTVRGLELIRLTAVSWPSGSELVDVLVRPIGTVIDLNSRFSGVWPEHFATAVPYEKWATSALPPPPPPPPLGSNAYTNGIPPPPQPQVLAIVDSPAKAREILCSFLTPSTPLLGHAIDNDLNSVRLCHPNIVDTVLMYPHPRGLPYRLGLKALTSKHLGRAIQTGGDRGHDSLEDAQATGDLVRVKVGEKWMLLKSKGWEIGEEELKPPSSPSKTHVGAAGDEQFANRMLDRSSTGKKRRKVRGSYDGAGDSTEDEDVDLGQGVVHFLNQEN